MELEKRLSVLSNERTKTAVRKSLEKTEHFGLTLTQEEVETLLIQRAEILKTTQRLEFGRGILPELMDAFCDSDFLQQDSFAGELGRLQEIFYHCKSETENLLSDEELIGFMRCQYDSICFGDLNYLEEICMETFTGMSLEQRRELKTYGITAEFLQRQNESFWNSKEQMEKGREACQQ